MKHLNLYLALSPLLFSILIPALVSYKVAAQDYFGCPKSDYESGNEPCIRGYRVRACIGSDCGQDISRRVANRFCIINGYSRFISYQTINNKSGSAYSLPTMSWSEKTNTFRTALSGGKIFNFIKCQR